MMTVERIIKAPCVDDLNILKNIIQSLEHTPIPFSFIDERNLEKLEEDKKISSVIHKQINEWKKQQGISHAKGLLQSIVSLLMYSCPHLSKILFSNMSSCINKFFTLNSDNMKYSNNL